MTRHFGKLSWSRTDDVSDFLFDRLDMVSEWNFPFIINKLKITITIIITGFGVLIPKAFAMDQRLPPGWKAEYDSNSGQCYYVGEQSCVYFGQ